MNFNHGGNVYKHLRAYGGQVSDLLDFSANINPLGMSPLGKEAMAGAYEQLAHYPDPDYLALRTALAAFYQVPLEWLAVYNGAAEAMHAYFNYLKPRRALLHGPSFVEYEKILQGLNTDIVWTYLSEDKAFRLDLDKYLEDINQYQPDLVILCSPNNPSGQKVDLRAIEAIEKTLNQWGGVLALDEAFIEFSQSADSDSYCSQLTTSSRVVVFKSLTKFFGVPGLRLGALVSPMAAFHQWDKTFGVPWRINSFAECYGIAAVQDHDYIEASRSYVREAREQLIEAFTGMPLNVYPSDADYLLLQVKPEVADRLVTALEAKHILIRDCSNYRGLSKGYFRVAVKTHEANLRLVNAFKEVLGYEG